MATTRKTATKTTTKTSASEDNSKLEARIKKLELRCTQLEKINSTLSEELEKVKNNSSTLSIDIDPDKRLINEDDWDRLKNALRQVTHPSRAADLI